MAEPFLSKALEPPSEKAIKQAITTLRQLVSTLVDFEQCSYLKNYGCHGVYFNY